jgi:hypothetical protein
MIHVGRWFRSVEEEVGSGGRETAFVGSSSCNICENMAITRRSVFVCGERVIA